MRGVLTVLAVAVVAALPLASPGVARAASPFNDVPKAFWAHGQIRWTVARGWMNPRSSSHFGVGHSASRLTAARVLALVNRSRTGTPVAADPYTQAVAAGWIGAGTGPAQPITQLQFDSGVVRVLGLQAAARTMSGLHASTGWRPPLPFGFGVEQMVRAVGARVNAPDGSDQWELWPSDVLRRANLAVEAYQLAHLDPWAIADAKAKTVAAGAMPKWTPLKRAVLGFALHYAGAPYVWGGTSPDPQSPLGPSVSGGFDCSGFVWWVMKLQTYRVGSFTWTGDAAIANWRTTYDMSAHVKRADRIRRADLRPGDILFWSSAPHGIGTASSTIYHTGIYLGNDWTINSHGSGDGVTLDYMGPGAGWFHDAFAFGWRIMPLHR
jgi:NlpC/P60 family